MKNSFKVIDGCLCIRMPEEIDHHCSGDICRMADHHILETKVESVLFDFEDTRFMYSSGIGILIGRYKMMSCFGGKVYVLHPDTKIRRMLEMSGMKKIVEIMD